jgi:hypothetical protein
MKRYYAALMTLGEIQSALDRLSKLEEESRSKTLQSGSTILRGSSAYKSDGLSTAASPTLSVAAGK